MVTAANTVLWPIRLRRGYVGRICVTWPQRLRRAAFLYWRFRESAIKQLSSPPPTHLHIVCVFLNVQCILQDVNVPGTGCDSRIF